MMWTIYGSALWSIHLPNVMTAIGVTKGAGKHIMVCCFPYIISTGCSEIICIKTDGVILINRLAVKNRFNRLQVISIRYSIPQINLPAMASLKHVKIQPWVLMKPFCRSAVLNAGGLRVKCHQGLVPSDGFFNGRCHGAPYGEVTFIPGISIPT